MWKNNMQAIANIGAMTRPQFRNMPTLDLAGAIDSYYDAKNAATQSELARQQREKMNAFADELTAQHPEAAARIAVDPAAYANYLDEQAKAERDQQYKLDYLNKQFNNSLALADRQNANSIGLARIKQQLANQAASEEKAARAAQLDEALKNGTIKPEEYNLIKRRELLGDIVNGGGVAPDGVVLTGNKAFDDAMAKNYVKDIDEYNTMQANMPQLLEMVDDLNNLADKTSTSLYSKGKSALYKAFNASTDTDDANVAYDNMVDNNILPLLRQTFGAAFTEREGERLKATLGNKGMTAAQKKQALNNFITQKQREMESKKRKIDAYNPQSNSASNIVIEASEYFK